MITRRFLTTFLVPATAALAACAADPAAPPDDDGGGGGGGGGGGDEPPVPLTPQGTFAITSDFDLASNAPGAAGDIARYFIRATDDPDDPTKFLVEELVKALPDGSVKNFVQQNAGFVTGYLNDRLLEIAPDFVTRIVSLGDAFGQVTTHFGTMEVLAIDASGHATKTVRGLHFKIDNVPMDFAFADYNIADTKVEGLTVTLSQTGQLAISDHQVAMKYGQVLRLAVDQAVIPMVDPSAQNLEDILQGAINCQAVGAYVYEALDFGSASTYETACNAGLKAASNAFYVQLNTIDTAALDFGLAGTARGVDKNQDGTMDEIRTGAWTGTLTYSGTPAPLGAATFFGAKQ